MAQTSIHLVQDVGGSIGFGARPALLIVDFVNGFLYSDKTGLGNIGAAARRTQPLLAAARDAGLPVIFTRIVYAEDGADAGVWVRKSPRLLRLTESAEASQVTACLAPRPGERIVRKTQPSAFFGTDLAAHLVGKGADTLIVTGCTTSGCIRATIVDAISNNFRPILVSDCLGDRSKASHAMHLNEMGQKYADVLDCDAVIGLLSGERVVGAA